MKISPLLQEMGILGNSVITFSHESPTILYPWFVHVTINREGRTIEDWIPNHFLVRMD